MFTLARSFAGLLCLFLFLRDYSIQIESDLFMWVVFTNLGSEFYLHESSAFKLNSSISSERLKTKTISGLFQDKKSSLLCCPEIRERIPKSASRLPKKSEWRLIVTRQSLSSKSRLPTTSPNHLIDSISLLAHRALSNIGERTRIQTS